jgi:hypothetical protein
MPRGVELIDRIGQADPERRLDRGSLARDQEPVKLLNACTYKRRVEAASPWAASSPTTRSTSSRVTSQAGRPQAARKRCSVPAPLPIVCSLKPRATCEASKALRHSF